MAKLVFVETRTVGDCFGTVGIVREVGSRRKLAEAEQVRPYGFDGAAARDAERLAREHGWEVIS